MTLIPFTIEQERKNERRGNIFSAHAKEQIDFIGAEINDYMANRVITQLHYHEAERPEKQISLSINSPGGRVASSSAI